MKQDYISHKREPFFQIAKDLIGEKDTILDIGSGNGSFAEFCNLDSMFLFEGNEDSVFKLKEKYKNTFYGRLPKLPFENGKFDIIHMSHVIEHLQPEEVYNTLKEFNRCLKPNGAIIISAPLMWYGFYDDLSHIKPYPPAIFEKYLCGGMCQNLSRIKISNNFRVERLQYRYLKTSKNLIRPKHNSFISRIFCKIINVLMNRAMSFYEKTGYTIVLRKNG